jgi:hypothetical protein
MSPQAVVSRFAPSGRQRERGSHAQALALPCTSVVPRMRRWSHGRRATAKLAAPRPLAATLATDFGEAIGIITGWRVSHPRYGLINGAMSLARRGRRSRSPAGSAVEPFAGDQGSPRGPESSEVQYACSRRMLSPDTADLTAELDA